MILITASTGQLGRLVIANLLKLVPASSIIAGARNPDSAKDLAELGVTVRRLDYDVPETITAALEGVERVLLISGNDMANRTTQHRRVIAAAKQASVELLAYTSILNASSSPLILAADHKDAEQALRDSGVPFTLLRNGWYHENYLNDLAGTIERGVMIGAAADGRVSSASREDFAAAAAAVLAGDGHENKTYELAGDAALTGAELAAAISEVSGKTVEYKNMAPNEYAAVLESVGVPGGFAAVLADSDAGIAKGHLESSSKDLSRLIGRPTTPFADSVRQAL